MGGMEKLLLGNHTICIVADETIIMNSWKSILKIYSYLTS